MKEINELLEKYNYFKDARIDSIYSLEDSSKQLTLLIDDEEGEIVDTIQLTFKNIKEAKILQNSVLSLLDMMSGITVLQENDFYGFALGRGDTMLHVHNAPLYIICKEVLIDEK